MMKPTPIIRFLVPRQTQTQTQTQTDGSSNSSSGNSLDGLWYLLVIAGIGIVLIVAAVYGGYRIWRSCYMIRHRKSLSSDSAKNLLISESLNSTSKDPKPTTPSEASHSTPPTSAGLHNHNVVVSGANPSPSIDIYPPSDVIRNSSGPSTPPSAGVATYPAAAQASTSSFRSLLPRSTAHNVYIEPLESSSISHPLLESSYPPRPFQIPEPGSITPFQIHSPQSRSDLELGPASPTQDFGPRHHVNINESKAPSNWYPGGVLAAHTGGYTLSDGDTPGSGEEMAASDGVRNPEPLSSRINLMQDVPPRQQQQLWFERTTDSVQLSQRKKPLPASAHNRHGVSQVENLKPEHRSLYNALSRNSSTSTSAPTVLPLPPPPPPPYTARDLPTEPEKARTSRLLLTAEESSPRSSTSILPPRRGGPRGPRTSPLNGGMRPLHPFDPHEQLAIGVGNEGAAQSTPARPYSLSSEESPLMPEGADARAGDLGTPSITTGVLHPENDPGSSSRTAGMDTAASEFRGSFRI